MAVRIEMAIVARSTARSAWPLSVSGKFAVGGKKAANVPAVQVVSSMASPPPTSASKRLSTRSWRTSRQRLAPIAKRRAISRRRVTERTSSRLATLAQASNSNTAASASNMGRVLYM